MGRVLDEQDLAHVRKVVHGQARRIPGLPRTLGIDDLISAGYEAAVHAARTYDPDRGRTWESWLASKVRWALIDYRRQQAWMGRNTRRHIAAGTENARQIISLTDTVEAVRLVDITADPCAPLDRQDLWAEILEAVNHLPGDQQHVIRGRLAGRPYTALAAELGVTDSRISQLWREGAAGIRRLLLRAAA